MTLVIAQRHAAQVDSGTGGVIKFYPTVEVDGGTHHLANVRGHHLVDNENGREYGR
jgi:hypothetical protein